MTVVCEIAGVEIKDLTVHGDDRGRVFEGWRAEWTDWPVKQMTEARARAGVIKGLHLHYKQSDWWRCVTGSMQVGLYDARPDSPTHGVNSTFDINSIEPTALCIPPGVAHGFHALEDLEMVYLLSETYDPGDEFGIRYDSVGIEWRFDRDNEMYLSERDDNLPARDQFEWSAP